MKKSKEYFKILTLRTIGNFMVITSLLLIAKTFYLPVREEIRYFIDIKIQKKYFIGTVKEQNVQQPKGLLARALNLKDVEILVPKDPQFSIVVPKIGANAKIISNVNAADEKIYLDVLNKGVAHTLGTAFPGEGGHIFLFAHSTDYFWNVGSYNAIFYLLNKLILDDEINIYYNGQRYVYRVIGKQVVDPSKVEFITRKTNKEFLTLQTCWPPGTTFKRLLVFATRVKE